MNEEQAKLRAYVVDLYEHREHEQCWYDPDFDVDCANWINCDHSCPIVKLREMAGIEGTEDGSIKREDTTS
jgi:hypothetical protein